MKIPRKTQTYKTRSPNLITKVFALFFVAVSLISLTNLLVFSRLMNTLKNEANALNNEQVNSASLKLDTELSGVLNTYYRLIQEDDFRTFNADTSINTYKLQAMRRVANNLMTANDSIHSWAVLLKGRNDMLSSWGIVSVEDFVRVCNAEGYDTAFWLGQLDPRYVRAFYPEQNFTVQSFEYAYWRENKALTPWLMKSYWKNDMLVVTFLDMEMICSKIGPYMEEGSYLFSAEGTLLYCSEDSPLITEIPQDNYLELDNTVLSVFKTECPKSSLQYVKLIPESQAMGMVRSSQNLFLIVTLLSLATASMLILLSVRRTLYPINGMLDLLQQHSDGKRAGDIREARSVLEEVLQQREEQAQTLAKQDALLSEYALRAQLKSLYVDAKQKILSNDGAVYILYIQVQYRESVSTQIQTPRAEMESLLQDVLSAELNRQFASCLMFQLEPGCFVTKVTLEKSGRMEDRMKRFLQRLEQERDFAYFTVVQSRKLQPGEDLAEIYAEVLQSVRQAQVCQETQWLTMEDTHQENEILFSKLDEQKLAASIHARQIEAAAEQAQEILLKNLHQGINYAQMEILCVALVNTVTYAISELMPNTERIAAVSGVYNILATRCKTAKAYCDTVLQFIRSCENSRSETGERDALLNKIQQYLQSNYHREFSGEEMAEALKVSRSYLSTYYKNKTGMNLSDSIQLYRIQKAMELMKDPDIKISEVGAMVGISSGNTFLRQFKKYTGMSPKDYRSKSRE